MLLGRSHFRDLRSRFCDLTAFVGRAMVDRRSALDCQLTRYNGP